MQVHGDIDDKALVHSECHPEAAAALVVRSWTVVVRMLPMIHGGTFHQCGFVIAVSFDGGCLLGTRQAHVDGSAWGLRHEVEFEVFASLDIVIQNEGVDP